VLLALLLLAQTYGPQHLPPVTDSEDPLVDAAPLVKGLIVRLAYATPENFAGRALYPADSKCLLRKSVAERLALVASRVAPLRLVAWDCFRPRAAQLALWKAHPQTGAVADPARGSLHERGVAVDLALAGPSGEEVPLPTKFDTFGPAAYAGAPLPDGPAKRNRDVLGAAMHDAGFRVNPKEWWHFSRLYGWRWPAAQQ
jgi:D-alanyl-D-alanine dipeptidase